MEIKGYRRYGLFDLLKTFNRFKEICLQLGFKPETTGWSASPSQYIGWYSHCCVNKSQESEEVFSVLSSRLNELASLFGSAYFPTREI